MAKRKKPVETPLTSNAFVEIPSRATLFLRGAAANPAIRRELAENGYGPDDHAEGLRLLVRILEVPASDASWDHGGVDPRAVYRELGELTRTKLRAASIVLRRRDPDAHARLFDKLDLSGREPELAAISFFQRFQTLSPKSGAVQTLAGLGITRELWERLNPEKLLPGPARKGDLREEDATRALRDWLETWTAVARQVLRSRESLIRLGLVGRRRSHPAAEHAVDGAGTSAANRD